MSGFSSISSLSTRLIVQEAASRGIIVRHLNPYKNETAFVELEFNGHLEYVFAQTNASMLYMSYVISEDKELTKEFLRRAGVAVCRGAVFGVSERDKAGEFAESLGTAVVLKPLEGAHGDSVFMDLRGRKAVMEALDAIFEKFEYVLVEEMFYGEEFRVIATKDRVVAVTSRQPANVQGDGEHTIEELIAIKNSDTRRRDSHNSGLLKISVDRMVLDNLARLGYMLDDIPPAGEIVYLRKNSNISTGGDSIDVTDAMHPGLREISVAAVNAIPGLPFAGVDIITSKSISEEPTDASYRIIRPLRKVPHSSSKL
jgi:D-alanine-D-alanine ligase-like ATP-grasp enzyme